MTGPACVCAGNFQLACDQVPRRRLTQSFTGTFGRGPASRSSEQRLRIHEEALAEQHQQMCEALKRRRPPPTLDPADRVLACPCAQGQFPLAHALSSPCLAQQLRSVIVTPHTVSIYLHRVGGPDVARGQPGGLAGCSLSSVARVSEQSIEALAFALRRGGALRVDQDLRG